MAQLGNFKMNPNFAREFLRSREVDPALREAAEKAAQIARDTAPVGDPETDPHAGRYRDSIVAEVTEQNGKRVGKVRAEAPEASFVEFGTINNAAHHTLRNAADRATK
jgi:HK97 gp10 family phage protein